MGSLVTTHIFFPNSVRNRVNRMKRTALFVAFLWLALDLGAAHAFSFSEEAQKDAAASQAKAAAISANLSAPCRQSLKGKKIAVLIAERHSGKLQTGGHGLLHQEFNRQLAALGLNTVSRPRSTPRSRPPRCTPS
jgi:hypothetical protein